MERGGLKDRAIGAALGIGFIVLLLAVWQYLAHTGTLDAFLFSKPSAIVSTFKTQITDGSLPRSLGTSAIDFVFGFGLSLVIGLPLGMVMGRYWAVEAFLDPLIWFGYSAPLIALYPLFVLVFGLGRPTVVALTFCLSVVPVLANAANGIRSTDPALVQMAKSFSAGERQVVTKVVVPASIPTLMAGVRLGMGRALTGVIIGEFFTGNSGVGYNVSFYAGRLRANDLMTSIVVVALLGVLMNWGLKRLERVGDSWRADRDAQ
jgi:NitT/TauT family transport system permease protein